MIVTFYKPSPYMAEATDPFYTSISTDAVRVYGITDLYVSGKMVVLKDDDNNQAVIDHSLFILIACDGTQAGPGIISPARSNREQAR